MITTIKKRRDFVFMQKNAKSFVTKGIIVQYDNEHYTESLVVGYTASKKVGNAVMRNLAKRRMRHLARLVLSDKSPSCFVLIARSGCVTMTFADLERDFRWAIRRLTGENKNV